MPPFQWFLKGTPRDQQRQLHLGLVRNATYGNRNSGGGARELCLNRACSSVCCILKFEDHCSVLIHFTSAICMCLGKLLGCEDLPGQDHMVVKLCPKVVALLTWEVILFPTSSWLSAVSKDRHFCRWRAEAHQSSRPSRVLCIRPPLPASHLLVGESSVLFHSFLSQNLY